jgi:alpha-methylacyl-CoA racemase
VVELAGLGPGPFCSMVLSDLGAEIVRIERVGPAAAPGGALDSRLVLTRGRPAVGVDLKSAAGIELVLRLLDVADAVVEGFRPGVVERLGLGPDVCLARNPRLIYGRITGYGQEGPLASAAGHDINYIAVAGALAPIGRAGEAPVPPLNLLGDFGGGGMLLALGMLAALFERQWSGAGQVVDAAMVDGAALLTTMFHEMLGIKAWEDERGVNFLDTGSHYYNVYETADGRYLSVGAIEPQFYRALMVGLGFPTDDLPPQLEKDQWPALRSRLGEIFLTRTADEWLGVFAGSDACVAPVLSLREAQLHPHNVARKTFIDVGDVPQPAPAPRFSRTPATAPRPAPAPGDHTPAVLGTWGLGQDEIADHVARGVLD